MDRVAVSMMLGLFGLAVITAGLGLMWLFVPSILISGASGLYLCFRLERQLDKGL